MNPLTAKELEHYQRHLSLRGFGETGQQQLRNSSVLVVGVGGLGCPTLQYLVAAGVGKIGIIDDDLVERSNLQRQVLFDYNDIGKPKVSAANSKLSRMNPHIQIISYFERLDLNNIEKIFDNYSVVIDGSDNFPTRFLVNDACILLDKILIHGSIFEFTGQVSVFNYQNGPTYRCLYGEPPSSGSLPNCSEIGVLGVLPGIVGSMLAMEAIKVITGVGHVLSGKLWLYDALEQSSRIIKLEKDSNLPKVISLSSHKQTCESMNKHNLPINEISASQCQKMILDESYVIIDVREGWEREFNKIDPSTHIPLGHFSNPDNLELLDFIDKDSKIIIYCKAGVRSRQACKTLSALGYKNLFNLKGGMIEWEENIE